jgi:NAD(P)H-dependent FMN reductase
VKALSRRDSGEHGRCVDLGGGPSIANPVKILGISGGLSMHSTHTGRLRAAAGVLPPDTEFEITTLHGIQSYNEDGKLDLPAPVRSLMERVRPADVVLFAVPEDDGRVAGVLEDAIDCGSRLPDVNVGTSKPVATVGASVGMMRTGRAELHLRQPSATREMRSLGQPDLPVTSSAKKFDREGNPTEPDVRKRVGALLAGLVAWTRFLRDESPTARGPPGPSELRRPRAILKGWAFSSATTGT